MAASNQTSQQREIENQSWVLWFHDLPRHFCIDLNWHQIIPPPEKSLSKEELQVSQEAEQDFILKVRRPQLTEPPEPSQELVSWLQSGWQNVDGTVVIDPKKGAQFNANADLNRRFSEWKIRRDAWAVQERPHRQAMDIFERFSVLHAQLERGSERSDSNSIFSLFN